jgi:hypothetical protein
MVMRKKSFSSGTPKGGHTKGTWSLISSTTVLPFSQSGEMGNLSTILYPFRLPTGKGLEFIIFCKDPE